MYTCRVPLWFFMRDERFKLITVESDFGAGKLGAAAGPQALIDELKLLNQQQEEELVENQTTIDRLTL